MSQFIDSHFQYQLDTELQFDSGCRIIPPTSFIIRQRFRSSASCASSHPPPIPPLRLLHLQRIDYTSLRSLRKSHCACALKCPLCESNPSDHEHIPAPSPRQRRCVVQKINGIDFAPAISFSSARCDARESEQGQWQLGCQLVSFA